MQEPAIGVEKPLKSDDNFLLDMGFLSGWKRIAEFLGVSVRTAKTLKTTIYK